MSSQRVYLPLVDGGEYPLEYTSGKELIQQMVTDDWAAPPRSLIFEATSDDGMVTRITILVRLV